MGREGGRRRIGERKGRVEEARRDGEGDEGGWEDSGRERGKFIQRSPGRKAEGPGSGDRGGKGTSIRRPGRRDPHQETGEAKGSIRTSWRLKAAPVRMRAARGTC